jgi:hypothetical protein
MSGADKTKLDGVAVGAEVNTVDSVFGRTGTVTALASDYDAVQVDYDNASSELAATNVQAAIDELAYPRMIAYDYDNPISTIVATTAFQNKLVLAAGSLVPGTYKLMTSYGWNHDNNSNDFEGRILDNGIQMGELHKQEPKDSGGSDPTGTTQRFYNPRPFFFVVTVAAVHSFTLQYRTDSAANESSIWEASMELWRYA